MMCLVVLFCAARCAAQNPVQHFQMAGALPPGVTGQIRLQRGGPVSGYFQPVEVRGPKGVQISSASDGQFDEPVAERLTVGLLIGEVYRLKVMNLPYQAGAEVFPTVEVIDRLYPPAQQAHKFPIEIELTQDELEMALEGKFVTRVIYVEESLRALPIVAPAVQPVFEIGDGEDLMEVADRLGRPVAILRIGGRVPDAEGPSEQFLFGCPALVKFCSSNRTLPEDWSAMPQASRRPMPYAARDTGVVMVSDNRPFVTKKTRQVR
jgi:hypothetical protein